MRDLHATIRKTPLVMGLTCGLGWTADGVSPFYYSVDIHLEDVAPLFYASKKQNPLKRTKKDV